MRLENDGSVGPRRQHDRDTWNTVLGVDRSIAHAAVRNRIPVSAPRVLRDGLFRYDRGVHGLVDGGTDRAVLVIPLKQGRTLLGIVAAADRTGRLFVHADVGLAETFVDRAAVTLDPVCLSAAACERIGRWLVAILAVESAAVYRLHRETGTLVLVSVSGIDRAGSRGPRSRGGVACPDRHRP